MNLIDKDELLMRVEEEGDLYTRNLVKRIVNSMPIHEQPTGSTGQLEHKPDKLAEIVGELGKSTPSMPLGVAVKLIIKAFQEIHRRIVELEK